MLKYIKYVQIIYVADIRVVAGSRLFMVLRIEGETAGNLSFVADDIEIKERSLVDKWVRQKPPNTLVVESVGPQHFWRK